jgi:hypothetical protein
MAEWMVGRVVGRMDGGSSSSNSGGDNSSSNNNKSSSNNSSGGWVDGRMDMDGRLDGRTDCGRLRRCCLYQKFLSGT